MPLEVTISGDESEPTVAAYAAALASDAPAPGGGSAVAVTAAFAVALGEKLCRFTIGKPAFAEFEGEMTATLTRFVQARVRLLQLAIDDENAYAGYARAAASPRTTDEERTTRKSAMSAALQESSKVPFDVAKEAIGFLEALERVAKYGNRNLIADVSVAGYLAEAAILGAIALVQSNADLLRTQESAEMASFAINLEQQGRALNKSIQGIAGRR